MGKRGSRASLVPLFALELEERPGMCVMLLRRDVTTHGKYHDGIPFPSVVKGSLKKSGSSKVSVTIRDEVNGARLNVTRLYD